MITVIIPVKDVDKYLDQAVSSALNQESVDCTVVVVDAGSTKIVEISSPFNNDSRLRLVRSETPLTAGGARNLGLTFCETEYVAFLDADDLWPPYRSLLMMRKFEDTKIKAVIGLVQNFGSDEAKQKFIFDQKRKKALLAGGILFKKEILEKVGNFDSSLQSGEFIDWYQRIKLSGLQCCYIDELVLKRRIHNESTTVSKIHYRPEYLKVVRKWMNQRD